MLQPALSPLGDIVAALLAAFLPTFFAVLRSPLLLLHPRQLSRLFFANVWVAFADPTDEGGREVKEDLIRRRAKGVVLDIGAGHGHTLDYLAEGKVKRYIAIEPSVAMHDKIRERARRRGFNLESVQIIAAGIEDTEALKRAGLGPQSVDTIVSVLTLCSIPSPESTIKTFVTEFLAPGGSLLWYEHVASPRPSIRRYQRWWTPLWSALFDGCKLDRPTPRYIENVGIWSERETWGKPDEDVNSLFWHQAGAFQRALS